MYKHGLTATVLTAVLASPLASFAQDGTPALKLGHYSTPDGLKGLALDRTGATPKARLDDSKEVVALFSEEILDRGDLVGTWLNGPDGKHWLRLDRSGEVHWLGRGDDVLVRDADAKPLGAATQQGIATPPEPETPREVYTKKLEAISVMKKVAGMKSEDASNLAKVKEAFAAADASMFVRTADDETQRKAFSYAPGPDIYGGAEHGSPLFYAYPVDDPWKKDGAGLQRFGGLVKGFSEYESQGNHLKQFELDGFHAPIAAKTPGVVWEVRSETTAIFVTLDGGRYHVSIDNDATPIVTGLAPEAEWPAPLQRSLVRLETLQALAEAGSIPKKTAEEVAALDAEWNKSTQAVWAKAKPEVDEVVTSESSYSAKDGRINQIALAYEAKIEKECGGIRKKYEQALVSFIEARDKDRLALYETAKARVKAVSK